jgi:hypothetical protein
LNDAAKRGFQGQKNACESWRSGHQYQIKSSSLYEFGCTDKCRVCSDDDADVNRIAPADDLAYLKNPIWWTGMITSESRQASRI